jgi:hypothetical protein
MPPMRSYKRGFENPRECFRRAHLSLCVSRVIFDGGPKSGVRRDPPATLARSACGRGAPAAARQPPDEDSPRRICSQENEARRYSANVQRSEEAGILQGAPEQGFPVAFHDTPMTNDNPIEIRSQNRCHRSAKCRAIADVKSEDAGETRVSFYSGEVMVEKVIPPGLAGVEIEDEVRNDQGSTGNMQQDVFLKVWHPCQGENLEFTGPVGRRGQQWLRGEVHDLAEPMRRQKRGIRECVASFSSIRVVQ